MAATPILVNPGEFRITRDKDENLVTKGLEACTGLILIHKNGPKLIRGLSHVFYSGSGQADFPKARKMLEEFLKDFPPNSTTAVTAAVPFEHEDKRSFNSMQDYVEKFLIENNIPLEYKDIQESVTLDTFPVTVEDITSKTIVVSSERAKIIYYNRGGVFLNAPNGTVYEFKKNSSKK